jgi:hypothetical protein
VEGLLLWVKVLVLVVCFYHELLLADIKSLSDVEDKELKGEADALSSSDTYLIQKQNRKEGWEVSEGSDIPSTAAAAEAGISGKGPAGVVRSEEKGPIALQDHQVHRLLEENRSLTHELEAVKLQLADAKTLVEIRGKELKGAQVFLLKADTVSTTDVVQKVIALNKEILQAASLLGEMLQNTERTVKTQERNAEAFEKARWMLGEQMTSMLAADSVNLRTGLNPLLVQVVLQNAITTWCRFVVSSWKPSDHTVADFLATIYSDIRQVGE